MQNSYNKTNQMN